MDDPPPVDDDLEYHVTFPAPLPDTEKFMEELKGLKKEPVIVLLGWPGSCDKDLAKYSIIYEQRGCITIRIPMAAEPKDASERAAFATRMLELILDMNLEDNQIVFHAFGNVSCAVLLHGMQELHAGRTFRELKVAGIVYDSGPSRAASEVAATVAAVASSVWTAVWKSVVGTAQWLAGVLAYYALGRTLLGAPTVYDQLRDGPWRWPELYLYSEADRSTPYGDVDEVILSRQKMGVRVEALRWDDTAHLSHLAGHRSAYEELCIRFVSESCSAASSSGDFSD